MSNKVKIVIGSSAYLLPETTTKYDIHVVPLKIASETEAYLVLMKCLCYD